MKDIIERLLVSVLETELAAWAKVLVSLTNIFLIALAAWLLMRLSARLLRVFNRRLLVSADCLEDRKRSETLIRVSRYVATVVIGAVTVMLILSEIGISIAPILATAGVAGLAVGFGAQSLVKDYFTGFVMLLENQIRVGDSVEVAGKLGVVEEVTLRYVRLRDVEGAVHYVPNGAIATVTNRSRDFAYAVIDFGVGYKENVDDIFELIRIVGKEMREDPVSGEKILDDIEIFGVEKWADSAVNMRCRFKVRAGEQFGIRREYLRRLKNLFDAKGVEIPFPSRTVYTRSD